jgi:hypothetical protein
LVHGLGSLPGAALATGRLTPAGAMVLALSLLTLGVWQLPELRVQRRAWHRWWTRRPASMRPAAFIVASVSAAALLGALRPDGRLHVDPLRLSRGQAVFVRGPTGRTALIVLGSADAQALDRQVAAHLAVWEHRLDDLVVLDSSAARAVGLMRARYPPVRFIQATPAARLELGDAQAVEVRVVEGRLAVASAANAIRAGPAEY